MKYRMTGGIIGIAVALALVTCSVWAESTGNAPRANRHAVIIGVGNYIEYACTPPQGCGA